MFKSLNRSISAPIVIIIIVVCAVLVGGTVVYQYYGIPKEKEETPETIKPSGAGTIPENKTAKDSGATSTPSPKNETADWETYRNEEYEYEIKYPKNWYVYDEDAANIYFQKGKEEEIGFKTQPFGPHSLAIKISVIENPFNLSPKEWAIKEIHDGVTIGSEEEIIVGNIKGIKIIPECEDIYCRYPTVLLNK